MPPDPLAVAVPLVAPLQSTLVIEAFATNCVGSVVVILTLVLHKLISRIIIKWLPVVKVLPSANVPVVDVHAPPSIVYS